MTMRFGVAVGIVMLGFAALAHAADDDIMTKDEAQAKATTAAGKLHYKKPKLLETRFEEARGKRPAEWHVTIAGKTPAGCGLLELEIPTPEGNTKYNDRQIAGEDVKVDECVALWTKDGGKSPDRDGGADGDATPTPAVTPKDSFDDLPVVDDGAAMPATSPTPDALQFVEGTPPPTPVATPRATAVARPAATPKPTPTASEDFPVVHDVTPMPHATVATRPAAAPIGIAECDQFVIAYAKCIDTLPGAKREGERDVLGALRDAWRDAAASSAEARKALPETCTSTAARIRAKPALSGCGW
jgi:hypothetical protein